MRELIQWVSLIISVLAIVLNVYNFHCVMKRVWVALFWISYWSVTAFFYYIVLLTNGPQQPWWDGDSYSSYVRLIQYGMLFTWFVANRWGTWISSWKNIQK